MDSFVRRISDSDSIEEEENRCKCKRCNYDAKHISILKRHLQKKSICNPIDVAHDISPAVLLNEIETYLASKQKYVCRICGKGLACRQTRSVHEKAHKKKEYTGLEFILNKWKKEILKEIAEEHRVPATTNIINGDINITNNIQVNAFTKEDRSYVIDNVPFLNQCIARTNKGLVELVSKLHFDPNKPQNRNLLLTNSTSSYMKYYDGKSWQLAEKKKLVPELISQSFEIMQDHYEIHKNEIHKNKSLPWSTHIRTWMASMDEMQKKSVKPLTKELCVMLWNQTQSVIKGRIL